MFIIKSLGFIKKNESFSCFSSMPVALNWTHHCCRLIILYSVSLARSKKTQRKIYFFTPQKIES